MLAHYTSGEGPPIVVLHGLFGMSKNWRSIARKLSKSHQVILVDLRNHGGSPHFPSSGIDDMVSDLQELKQHLGLEAFNLLGHSLGGKVAIHYALLHPEDIMSLIIVDMTPLAIEPHHLEIFQALDELPISTAKSRLVLTELLAQKVGGRFLAQFLLKNVRRSKSEGFEWTINLPAIKADYESNLKETKAKKYQYFEGPALAIYGGKSDYVQEADRRALLALFPNIEFASISDAGHWVHADRPEEFMVELNKFLDKEQIM